MADGYTYGLPSGLWVALKVVSSVGLVAGLAVLLIWADRVPRVFWVTLGLGLLAVGVTAVILTGWGLVD